MTFLVRNPYRFIFVIVTGWGIGGRSKVYVTSPEIRQQWTLDFPSQNWIDHMQSLGFSFLDCPGYCSGFCVFLPTEVVGFSLIASCVRFNDEQTKGAQ